ncbi:SDR family oxidoreductase [Mycobacterium gastri]|uniref:Short-chain dehydrogenase n=1 Tax=Mycobacterium gastri TaxID=1777 RepID=A0A1X1URS7_MYCGS|nr:SDR family oxidoreductase [Mycobacterium gastri]ETW26547.1 hypothetical protein MGAST_16060 [Mycobacterium gastri 'Wayne']ORV59411.1 hypothetical protein AWC07_19860 [Mycobacterium gastri]
MAAFESKVAIVTGAAQGIGQAYAQALAREGASVVVADINAELAAGVAKQIVADGGTAIPVPVDVSDEESAKTMAGRTVAEFGGIDYLQIPLSRMGTPEDLVGMCLFLLSDQASWITGQIFNVDGGQVIRS